MGVYFFQQKGVFEWLGREHDLLRRRKKSENEGERCKNVGKGDISLYLKYHFEKKGHREKINKNIYNNTII